MREKDRFSAHILGTGLAIGTDFVGTKCGCFWFGLVIAATSWGQNVAVSVRPTRGISAQTPCGDEALQDEQNNSLSNGGPPRLFHPYLGVRQGDMAQGLDPGRISILWAGVDPRVNPARSY